MGLVFTAGGKTKDYTVQLEKKVKTLETAIEQKEDTIIDFKQHVEKLETEKTKPETEKANLESEKAILEEKIKLLLFRQFGKAAEKFTGAKQLPLFDRGEAGAAGKTEKPVEKETITRNKPGRKPVDEKIPRQEVILDIPEEEKACGCGSPLVCIGEDVTERLVMIPGQVYVVQYHAKKYACPECEGSGDEDAPPVKTAEVPASIMPGSIATPELLSYIFTKKYSDYTPFYRQEAAFERIGVNISRQNMANWQQKICGIFQPLLLLLQKHVQSGNVVQMDETPMQVMDEPGRENRQKSYMWLARGGPPGQPALIYKYQETREKKHIVEILGGFKGFLQSDGFSSYESAIEKDLYGIIHVGCFARVRRKFFQAKSVTAKDSLADNALSQIQRLYTVERDLREKLKKGEITAEAFQEQRRERCKPILAAFHEWLLKNQETVLPSSNLGGAINYALHEWPSLERYLDDWQLTPDNNAAERGIRPFVMGRKNRVMSGSPAGAKSSCELYTLIETAKANNWNPAKYLTRIFQIAAERKSNFDWAQLLPWNLKS